MMMTEPPPQAISGTFGSIHIRRADSTQVDVLKEVAENTFKETFSGVNTPENMKLYLESAFKREKLLAELADGNNFYFLIEKDQAVVGYIKLQGVIDSSDESIPTVILEKRTIFLERFYLCQAVHGTGIAQAMMDFCFDFARQLKREAIWLGVWEKNPRALAFYRKKGFEPVGAHAFILGDAIQMDHWMMYRL